MGLIFYITQSRELFLKNNRIIGVVTIKDEWAVQSFGYNFYLPLGHPEVLVENLNRWGVDEIYLNCIDRSNLGPNVELLEKVARVGISTPLIYGGGIRNAGDAVNIIKAGADRVSVDNGWHRDIESIKEIHNHIGTQALIASMPVGFNQNGKLKKYDYLNKKMLDIPEAIFQSLREGWCSELILVDFQNEGAIDKSFNTSLIEALPDDIENIIPFGGISSPEIAVAQLRCPGVVAVAIGNYLNYQEHCVQRFKDNMSELNIRPSYYSEFKVEKPIYVKNM